jgi:hypothetical protein
MNRIPGHYDNISQVQTPNNHKSQMLLVREVFQNHGDEHNDAATARMVRMIRMNEAMRLQQEEHDMLVIHITAAGCHNRLLVH